MESAVVSGSEMLLASGNHRRGARTAQNLPIVDNPAGERTSAALAPPWECLVARSTTPPIAPPTATGHAHQVRPRIALEQDAAQVWGDRLAVKGHVDSRGRQGFAARRDDGDVDRQRRYLWHERGCSLVRILRPPGVLAVVVRQEGTPELQPCPPCGRESAQGLLALGEVAQTSQARGVELVGLLEEWNGARAVAPDAHTAASREQVLRIRTRIRVRNPRRQRPGEG